ncbi:transcriptional regulator [Catellatospora sp. IY07-71]|uniref:MerR family transcriptional regulator n=1 Tax=Catellatospora sp. IY07-71 TaxID=2728827 RepID=UPI001BB3491B|nr:MerR family transcriptional regulator [Catellatospora sp. IY07-71]BCJ75784.1 transcriptional regulator [Catellatospora sp. IY07-71]
MNRHRTAGDVARHLGIAVTTLRSWHQRYGLGPSGHEAHRHRRYTDDDVARLEVMCRLTTEGVPAAAAARVALAGPPPPAAASVNQPGVDSAVRGLVMAAVRLDMPSMLSTIFAAVRRRGVVYTWDNLICPAMREVSRLQEGDQHMIEVEHLLSRCVLEVFWRVPRPFAAGAVKTVLACAAEEQHTLALEALAAALAEQGCGTRMLGARVPAESLAHAVRRTGPAAVFVWSQQAVTGDPDYLRVILAVRPRPALVAAAGPGWPGPLPEGVGCPADLAEALRLAVAVIGRARSA